jgi:PEP-CTERM putative exosortase interaction domain
MKSSKLILGLCAALVAASAFAQATVTVNSQNPAPGDLFTNTGSANLGLGFGNPNWVYNNTRGGGSVGIRTNYPRSGNGSVYFNSPGISGKADIEYFADPVLAGGNFAPNPFDPSSILGPLAALSHLSYEWYRASSSTAPNHLHPVLRLGILRVNHQDNSINLGLSRLRAHLQRVLWGSAGHRLGSRITLSAATTGLWANASLGFGDPNVNFSQVFQTIPDWVSAANAVGATLYVISVNAGIGSGWDGTFTGAVDNITFGFNNTYTTYNFKVVPEPASMVALGSGLIGLLGLRRRKR